VSGGRRAPPGRCWPDISPPQSAARAFGLIGVPSLRFHPRSGRLGGGNWGNPTIKPAVARRRERGEPQLVLVVEGCCRRPARGGRLALPRSGDLSPLVQLQRVIRQPQGAAAVRGFLSVFIWPSAAFTAVAWCFYFQTGLSAGGRAFSAHRLSGSGRGRPWPGRPDRAVGAALRRTGASPWSGLAW